MPRAALHHITINFMKMGAWDTHRTPIVFVHGLAASSAFWFHAAENLGKNWPILVYDLRGHGRSAVPETGYTVANHAEDLYGLLDHLEIASATLVGHSFGGAVALQAAVQSPGRFTRLALADTRLRAFQGALTPQSWPKWQEQRALLEGVGLGIDEDEPEAGISVLTALAKLTLSVEGGPEALPKWVMEFFGQRQSRPSATRWIELVEKTTLLQDIRQEGDISAETLKNLPLPLFGAYGSHSPLLPSGQALKDARPDTSFHIVEGAGHFFPAVRPKELTEPLEAFLA